MCPIRSHQGMRIGSAGRFGVEAVAGRDAGAAGAEKVSSFSRRRSSCSNRSTTARGRVCRNSISEGDGFGVASLVGSGFVRSGSVGRDGRAGPDSRVESGGAGKLVSDAADEGGCPSAGVSGAAFDAVGVTATPTLAPTNPVAEVQGRDWPVMSPAGWRS